MAHLYETNIHLDRNTRKAHLLLYRQLRRIALNASDENILGENHRAFRATSTKEARWYYLEIDPAIKRLKLIEHGGNSTTGQSGDTTRRCDIDERPIEIRPSKKVAPMVGFGDRETFKRAQQEHYKRRLIPHPHLDINTPQAFHKAQELVNDFEKFVTENPDGFEVLI